jgi:antitoxin MazE
LALRIPSALAEETELREGSEVELAARKGKLIVARSTDRFSLANLLSGITEDNIHTEAWSGAPAGREVWDGQAARSAALISLVSIRHAYRLA